MAAPDTRAMKVFRVANSLFLGIAAALCILPLIHVIAMSFSSNAAVGAGRVTFWPVDFTISAYRYLLTKFLFWNSLLVTLRRVAIGGSLNIFLAITLSYPLSKEARRFRFRTVYAWFIFSTMLISGGLMPLYFVVYSLGLMGTIWSLVLPGAVPVFLVVLMLNFYRQLPIELEEAAFMDGASHWRTLWQIYVPCSLPAIATITLLAIVGHWNAWFDGLIYAKRFTDYPLQSYMQTVIVAGQFSASEISAKSYEELKELSDRTLKMAQIFVAMVPILMVYPFLQRYFISGIVLGSVKG